MKAIKYILIGLILLSPALSFSNTLKVPADFNTIQAAINAAQNGDTILVADGIYEGEINFNGLVAQSVIIISEAGPDNCIIDCQNKMLSSSFIFNSQDCKSTVEGFTIRNAYSGVNIYAGASPMIINNIIDSCEIGIFCASGATPIISSNTIKNCTNSNNYYEFGGGIRVSDASPIITDNEIINNNALKGGGIYCKNSSPVIEQNNIIGNSGGGICCILSNAKINHNLIKSNINDGEYITESLGGGIYISGTSSEIVLNKIENNRAVKGGGIYCKDVSPSIRQNEIFENYGGGIYCENASPRIIWNEIFLNNFDQGSGVIMNCEFDDFQRPDRCYVGSSLKGAGISMEGNSYPDIFYNIIYNNSAFNTGGIFCGKSSSAYIINNHILENKSSVGGAVYVENSWSRIINNIIANTEISSGTTERLMRWYRDDLFIKYTYEGGKLDYVSYYFGFINNGPPGDVQITGCTGLNTSVWAETGERFWVEAPSDVDQYGNGGGFRATISLDTSSFGFDIKREYNFVPHGCNVILQPHIISCGTSQEGLTGAGIIAINHNNIPDISYNNFYNNSGEVFSFIDSIELKSATLVDIIGINGNILADPLLDTITYEILPGSPCIDAGLPDISGLGLYNLDFNGNPRVVDGDDDGVDVIDIGAFEIQGSPIEIVEYVSICQGEEYEGHTETDEFQRTLNSSTGKDSIVITHLTVNPTYETEEHVSICEGDDYLGLTEEGEHRREFKTVNDCDSIVITHLTVFPTYEIVENISICEGQEYMGYTEVGQHSIEIQTVNNCDSSVINLTIHSSFKPTFTNNADTLTSDVEYTNYQWYDSDGAIAGATSREFVIEKSGEYYLEATNENGCTYSSNVKTIYITAIDNYKTGGFAYSIMPNPNNGVFSFRIDSNPPEKFNLKLINSLGQVIEIRDIVNPGINQIEHFDVSHLSKGIYHFVITTNKDRENRKVVIQ